MLCKMKVDRIYVLERYRHFSGVRLGSADVRVHNLRPGRADLCGCLVASRPHSLGASKFLLLQSRQLKTSSDVGQDPQGAKSGPCEGR